MHTKATNMKGMTIIMKTENNKTPKSKRIIAMMALIAIVALIIAFVISAFTTKTGDSNNTFFALFFGIIAIPIFAWLMIFCIGRFQNKHTMAELFPENNYDNNNKKTE